MSRVSREFNEPAIAITEIDLAEALDNNHLQDPRPEIYGIITETD
jgi:hypothetical protein